MRDDVASSQLKVLDATSESAHMKVERYQRCVERLVASAMSNPVHSENLVAVFCQLLNYLLGINAGSLGACEKFLFGLYVHFST
jgi:hypothetical protein